MPESTCLHIQDRESGPIRVVELPWISVRIGRAAFCEVRLADQDLTAETCRLTRRGRNWNLVPIGSQSLVMLEGRTVKGPCPLPFNVPFRVGSYCLTLRQDVAADPDWEMYPASTPPGLAAPVPAAPSPDAAVFGDQTDNHLDRHQAALPPRPDVAEADSRPARDRKRWEARWKAAEAHLKSRAEGLQVSGGEGHRVPFLSPKDGISTKERPSPSGAPRRAPAPTPLIDPKSRPIPTPQAPRIEPNRSAPFSEPIFAPPAVDPVVRPEPAPVIGRYVPAWTAPLVPAAAPSVSPSSQWHSLIDRERPSETPTSPTDRHVSVELGGSDHLDPDSGIAESVAESSTSATPFEVIPRSAESLDVESPTNPDSRTDSCETGSEVAQEFRSSTPDLDLDDRLGNPEGNRDFEEVESRLAGSEVPKAEIGLPEYSNVVEQPSQAAYDDTLKVDAQEDHRDPVRGDRVRTGREAAPAWERFKASSRPQAREPKKSKASRDRTVLESRREATRGIRPGDRDPDLGPGRHGEAPRADEAAWPSVKDILANRRTNAGPPPTIARARTSQQSIPTVPCEPGQWKLPLWLAWPPVAVSILIVGIGASVLSWLWTLDSSAAGVMTLRLMEPGRSGRRKQLPESMVPDGRWLTTTAQHMTHWGLYFSAFEGDEKGRGPEVASMLTQALQISPLNPTARLAVARLETSGKQARESVRSLGLSRDAVSLAWSARQLLDQGKKEAALNLYARALSCASRAGLSRTVTPRFDEHESAQRYLLPGEDVVRDILSDMVLREKWTFRDWSRALPQDPMVLLATARLLREKARVGAEPLLDAILKGGVATRTDGSIDARSLAARAEAFALGSRLKEAEQEYRQAIELADRDLVRRSWWFNLSDIARRLNDETQRQAALRAAVAVATTDDITRRASMNQRMSEYQPPGRGSSPKAN